MKSTRLPPPNHYAFASVATVKAEVRLRSGDVAGALALANIAVAVDEAAIKEGREGAFYLPSVLTYRSNVELEAKLYEQAQIDAERALIELRKTCPDTPSSKIGTAYLLLGRALRAKEQMGEARLNFEHALQHLQATLGTSHSETREARKLLAMAIRDQGLR